MPDAPEKAPDGSQPATQAAQKGFVVTIVSLTVLLLIVTPVVLIFATKAMIGEDSHHDRVEVKKSEDGKLTEFIIKDQQCVIGRTKGDKFAKFTIAIQVRDPDGKMAKCFSEKTAENPRGQINLIKASITRIAMDKTYDQIRTPAGLKAIGDEVKQCVDEIIAKEFGAPASGEGFVVEVFFPSFVIVDLKA